MSSPRRSRQRRYRRVLTQAKPCPGCDYTPFASVLQDGTTNWVQPHATDCPVYAETLAFRERTGWSVDDA